MGMKRGPLQLLLQSGLVKSTEQGNLALLLIAFICVTGMAIIFSLSVIQETAPALGDTGVGMRPDLKEAIRPLDEVQ